MNKLKINQQVTAIQALIEGCSVRSAERMTGIHRDTILRLMVRVGKGCKRLMDETMRGLPCRNIQVDEIWAYVSKKQAHLTNSDNHHCIGDMWTFVALDADSKIIPCFLVGKRSAANTRIFIEDLSSRLTNRVQLSSDSMRHYVHAAEESFGANIDYGQVVKFYEAEAIGPGRYSPPRVTSAEKKLKIGKPDFSKISTSHIERQNLTMRMSMRRFTRLTNAFSKKLENLRAAVALHFAHYNFVRIHKTLGVTPAMETGITDRLWTIQDLIQTTN